MDLEGRCRLDWWANTSTLLGTVEVSMTISDHGAGWHAHGRLADEADREGFAFLCAQDPVFTLRFEDGSGIAVTVHPTDNHRQFTLNDYTGPRQRAVEQHIELHPGHAAPTADAPAGRVAHVPRR